MARMPFSVYKRSGRTFWYVQFKDSFGNYLPAVSTKQALEERAVETAFRWLRDGLPVKKINKPGGNSIIPKKSSDEAMYICNELKQRGYLKNYVIAGSKQDTGLIEFLENFWDYDTSPYVKRKLHKEHSIHRRYTIEHKQAVERYWKPFFKDMPLGCVTNEDIENFMDNIDNIANQKLQDKQKGAAGLSASRKNKITQTGTIPLKWAYSKKLIQEDVTSGIIRFSEKPSERHILTPEIVQAIFNVKWDDERCKLANMLSAVTGLRAGEVQGLLVRDLGWDCLYVRNSWNYIDKLKTTKNNETRMVEVPFPSLINSLLCLASQNPHGMKADSYVFWSEKLPSKPMEGRLFVKGLRNALIKIGMNEKQSSDYLFHGWRHFFTSYMAGKIDNKLLKSETGHKTDAMISRYSDHLLPGESELIRQTKQEVFGGLIAVNKLISTIY